MKDIKKFEVLIGTIINKSHFLGMENQYINVDEETKRTNEIQELKQEALKMYMEE